MKVGGVRGRRLLRECSLQGTLAALIITFLPRGSLMPLPDITTTTNLILQSLEITSSLRMNIIKRKDKSMRLKYLA